MAKQVAAHRDEDHGVRDVDALLVVAQEASSSGRPAESSLETELIANPSKPGMIVSDHGTEFTQERHPRLVEGSRDRMALHRPGQADAEWLCRILQRPHRDELLNESLFFGFDHNRSAIAEWREDLYPYD